MSRIIEFKGYNINLTQIAAVGPLVKEVDYDSFKTIFWFDIYVPGGKIQFTVNEQEEYSEFYNSWKQSLM